ncbi:MAG TPA: hypothetical protein VHB27_18735, partial [Rhodopila sp.]|uniref:hypothetical protein n=1 Tax=Rhodopila sp. TaxID=2480087 RepID=UPI002BD7CB75
WDLNTSGLWWEWNGTSWSGNGTATSPLPAASANDTIVKNGSAAAITDANGDQWTVKGGVVYQDGQTAGYSANVAEIAYVNGNVWHENTSNLWWEWNGTSWSGNGTATSPLPTPTTLAVPTGPSTNDTIVLAGSKSSIIDASKNTWTISNGTVLKNGQAAGYSANVSRIAYVNGNVWQQNTSGLWWKWNGTTWPGYGTSTNPLPSSATIGSTTASTTVSQSQISVLATQGDHMVFVTGTGDSLNLSGGTEKITDTGSKNTYVLPTAGHGVDAFTSNILAVNDVLDLRPALAATSWNGSNSTLSQYLSVSDTASGAALSISAAAGGAGTTIATIAGTNASLNGILTHAIV